MPLERELLRTNPMAADAFLGSQDGAILHEVGHYVAANLDGLIRGHIIVPANLKRHSGAFVPDDHSAGILNSNSARWSLVSSAGVIAEYHFCGRAKLGAAKADIAAYQSKITFMRADGVVEQWKRDHLDRIAAHAACIEENFDRCVRFCRTNRFLIRDHHVIPTAAMRSPRQRGLRERLDELLRTYPEKARSHALIEFEEAKAGLLRTS